ncbi:GTPase Era [Buchnera aphidicola]|uniref:GTPase Era n=1 Tax=Buchnera aphidicola (Cinara cf. splendens/pseudotsugae 3390) TaxID=2518980 RepID=A0A451CWS3_9GAMM|nr:GTPase Era [Buchnera aphidicola]VFP77741.1 GTPase Era [Buchnera aphidicola (Cinara cf. splendens/pseudotsugae 3390)]
MKKDTFFGKVLIVGRTNVGKSTLLNQFIKSNVSITSRKPNTTQLHVTGIYTSNITQFELIDSPGIQISHKNYLDKKKLRNTYNLIQETNIIIFMITSFVWTAQEKKLLEYIKKKNKTYIVVINKIDKIKNKKSLLPFIFKISQLTKNHEIFLISAKKKMYLKKLLTYINKKLPISKHKYSDNVKTICTKKFLTAEIIRETLINLLNQELVYSFIVSISRLYQDKKKRYIIECIIFVKNIRHKKIIIGSKGEKIRQCCRISRYKLEKLFKEYIFLNTQVKIK